MGMSEKCWFMKALRLQWCAAGAILMATTGWAGPAGAQTANPAVAAPNRLTLEANASLLPSPGTGTADSGVVQAGCSTCGELAPPPACDNGCGECCVPGRRPCCPCNADSCIGHFFCDFYQCICCPDPCYDPRWIAVANAAFFVDSARPVTQMRIRYDAGFDMKVPDRNEFFWARADGMGKGPNSPGNASKDAPPATGIKGETKLDYNELIMTMEAATGGFSLAIDTPYRSIDPQVNPHAANFDDINITTKSLLLDCPLLQIAFQFRTFIPTGNFTHGIGTGHVSLEPSLLTALRLGPNTYLQTQLSEWIPLGGDTDYQGAILHYHVSLNQVLFRPVADVQLIGTLEFNGWSFQTGDYTDPVLGRHNSGGDSFLSAGPGLRFVLCDKVDLGVGSAFQVSGIPWPNTLIRSEFRWRF
jgi:hypothetical protein